MNINAIVSGAKFAISRTGLILSKHAPDILTSAGVVGFVGTAVLASKATLEINDVLEPHLNDLEKINAGINNPDIYPEKYTPEAAKRDKIIVYTRIVTDIAKKYAPTIILGVASAVCVFSANNIMKKRLAGAIAAYEAVDKAYRVYKKRVKDVLGEEASRKVEGVMDRLNTDDIDPDGPDGKAIAEAVPELDKALSDISMYARAFDETNRNWNANRVNTEIFLNSVQNYMNDLLVTRGHVFLNDVYDALGLTRTREGSVVGWVRKTKGHEGDGYIDFHILEGEYRKPVRTIEHGDILASCYVLDFNVDGVIWDLI